MAAPKAEDATVGRQVLETIERLVAELGGPKARGAVSLDDALDRDLGIGSLERVELLLRLEKQFGVRLADAVMASAVTPLDLVAAIGSSGGAAPEAVPRPISPLPPGVSAPASAKTLNEVLRWHAEGTPERSHIFLREEDGTETAIPYGRLWRHAGELAAGLHDWGLRSGDRVAIMLRTEEAFFSAFFGALLAGGVPVPIYPPLRADRLEEYAARQVGILGNAGARVLLTFRQAMPVANLLRPRVPALEEVSLVERMASPAAAPPSLRLAASDPALIQYTSGSTGEPKGVLLSHANLLANIAGIGRAIEIGPSDVGVSWLPLYHDMGLIGSWLTALFFGVPIAILSPLAFLARPARWIQTLHAHRATVSPAPNFAFELCVRKIADEEIEGVDLSSWRLAFNGSEPVSPETIERFTRRFAPYGFRREAMCPVYGLAESSVALTVSPLGRPPRVDRVTRDVFQRSRRAERASPDEASPLTFVACGRPLAEHRVRIVDGGGRPVGERVEGRIEFRGPSVTAGYFGKPEATREVLRDGWMDSGDLGYWAEGDLFITGRQKDLIIKAGRNLYPQEVEEVVGDIPGIRKGCVAAFGVADPEVGTERLVVVAESRGRTADEQGALRAAVLERVVATLGIPPDTVVIAGPGSVLKTSSGKVRRRATRDAYLGGMLGRGRRSVLAQWLRLLGQDVVVKCRSLAVALGRFVYTTYVGVLLFFTLPLLWAALLLVRSGERANRPVRIWCRSVLFLGGCRLRVEGVEHLTGTTPAVIAVNHSSYIDSVVLLAALPLDFRFVAKRELLSYPLISTIIRKVGHLTVERVELSRSVSDAEAVSRALRAGSSLCVFPEGTFIAAPGLLPFRLGAFKAAVEASRPIVPVTLRGTREVLPPETVWMRPGTIHVVVGPPAYPAAQGWQEMVRLRDLVREEIASEYA
jgi:fatty-acyl-CoA synthase